MVLQNCCVDPYNKTLFILPPRHEWKLTNTQLESQNCIEEKNEKEFNMVWAASYTFNCIYLPPAES